MRTRLIGLTLLLAAAAAGACNRSPLLIRDIDVWSPDGISRHRDVLIADGRIKSVEATARRRPAAGTRVIEGAGATLLPGLIDSHLHLSYNGWRPRKPEDHRWGSAAFTGPQTLMAGVTNGRIHLIDLKEGPMLRGDSQDDCVPLPRLQAAGPAFIPGAPTTYDGVVWGVTGVDDAIDRVKRVKAAGFDWISFHEMHKFKPEEREAIVRTAREQGMRLLGSGYNQDDVESSLAMRPHTIDYIDTSTLPEYAPRLLETAKAQPGLIWVARLGVHLRRHVYELEIQRLDEPHHYAFIPAAEVPALKEFTRKELLDTTTAHSRRMTAAFPTLKRKFQQLRESGVTMAAGTDAGSPGHAQSDAIWWELHAWVVHGATPTEALMAVAVNGAKVLDRDDLGVIRPGAVGDFVIYTGDIAKGEFLAGKVTHVAKGGVLYVDRGRWVGPSPP